MRNEETSARGWTEDDVLLALYLYFQLPFGQLDSRNREVQKLAKAIGRSSNAVAMKLANLASLDPKIVDSGRKGLSKASQLDRKMYARFGQDWDGLVEAAQAKWILKVDRSGEGSSPHAVESRHVPYAFEPFEGPSTVQALVNQRVGQSFFRRAVLANYDEACCITSISEPQVLIASHISPWGKDRANRHNPANGLLLSATLDRAFDAGLISIDHSHRVVVSKRLLENPNAETREYFSQFHKSALRPAARFDPDPALLNWHFTERFEDNRAGH